MSTELDIDKYIVVDLIKLDIDKYIVVDLIKLILIFVHIGPIPSFESILSCLCL